jgi:hypothetical protein
MSDQPPPTCICPIFNSECFETPTDVEPYDYSTIYLRFPSAQPGEIMSATSMPQTIFDGTGAIPQKFAYLTSTGTATRWKSYGNNLGIVSLTRNTGFPVGVQTNVTLPEGTSFVDVFVSGYGGFTQQPPPYFTTTGQIFNVAENGTWGSGAVVYFPRMPVQQFSVLLTNNEVHLYINNVEFVNTSAGNAPTNGVALNPVLTAGTGGTAGRYSLLSTQYTYLVSNGQVGKNGRILSIPLNTLTTTQVVSNYITGNLTNTQFNSTQGITNLASTGNSGSLTYNFPTAAGIVYTQQQNPGGVLFRCYAY